MSLRDQLLRALPFNATELDLLIWSAPLRYKTYYIKKRQPGLFREVSQPTPEVKLLQRWLVANVLSNFPVHTSAKAYKRGTGLIENVQPHVQHRFLLKVDFENFFPSIKADHFIRFASDAGIDDLDSNLMKQVLFKRTKGTGSLALAIGAPSSPHLSNLMLHSLDCALALTASRENIAYTRYADDLSFSTSTPGVLSEFEKKLPLIIRENCDIPLKLNAEKTIHASKKSGRRITGLTITPQGTISVGLEQKKLLRSQIHRFSKNELNAESIQSLTGYIAYLASIEPAHLVRLARYYGIDVMRALYPPISDLLV
ncbi:RNA-directed DNA polymerase [Pseudoduganella sp. DS3]|uniref:RNA-directed DNA polymerase n=1 Tax=Pseudoduganella guangdongensis TaxID=2692179 RepID=A0A6N9HLW9_9BURK|nr:retron St85 family RNA-directed DNA polymerase [Pseudoduganella guangdongensis]MYN04247.1 RNA-directed DNA polymerase [Pseudoduganella guangdongensis]